MKRASLLLLLSLVLPFVLYGAMSAGAVSWGGMLFAALAAVMAVTAWRG